LASASAPSPRTRASAPRVPPPHGRSPAAETRKRAETAPPRRARGPSPHHLRPRPPAHRTTTTTLPPLPPLPSPPRAPAIGREYHHHAGPQGMYSLSLYSPRSDLARGYFRVNYAGHGRGREKQRMQKGVRAAEVEDPALPPLARSATSSPSSSSRTARRASASRPCCRHGGLLRPDRCERLRRDKDAGPLHRPDLRPPQERQGRRPSPLFRSATRRPPTWGRRSSRSSIGLKKFCKCI
jgi:hypothetical protein